MRTVVRENDFSLFGVLCAIALSVVLLIKKVVALCEYYSHKYPKAATIFWFVFFFVIIGLAGKGEMELELIHYGN